MVVLHCFIEVSTRAPLLGGQGLQDLSLRVVWLLDTRQGGLLRVVGPAPSSDLGHPTGEDNHFWKDPFLPPPLAGLPPPDHPHRRVWTSGSPR